MRKIAILSLMLVSLLAPLGAHHSFDAEYDASKIQNLTGTVTKIDWVNPHAYIYFTAKDAKGEPQTFRVELGPPYALLRGGWKRDSVKIGDTITVEKAAMAKDGSNTAGASYETSLILANGQKMVMR